MSLSIGLSTALSGLISSQRALDVIANNIANVNTEGYTRKIVRQESVIRGDAGAGIEISALQRQVDKRLYRDILVQTSTLSHLTVTDQFLAQLQSLFGEPGDNNSISHLLGDLNSALETLATHPAAPAAQFEAVETARGVTQRLNGMSEQLQAMRLEADRAVAETVAKINERLGTISDLNDSIMRSQAAGGDAVDLRDKRDVALKDLALLLDVTSFERSDGTLVVLTGTGRTLVDDDPVQLSHDPMNAATASMSYAAGDFAGIALPDGEDVTGLIRSGELKAYLDMRDQTLPNLQAQLDRLAGQLRQDLNQVHNRGTAFPAPSSYTGTRSFVDPATQTIAFGDGSDTVMALLDGRGNQLARTTITTIMGGSGPFSIDQLAAGMQGWLQGQGYAAASVAVDATGKFTIDVGDAAVGLAFRDQVDGADGAAPADAAIAFNSDGVGAADQTVSGFSSFLGLNDLFALGHDDYIHDSAIKPGSYRSPAGTLSFTDNTGALGTVNIPNGASLAQIATAINAAGLDVAAAVVPEGAGFRLRLTHGNTTELVVTGSAVATLGLGPSITAAAAAIGVSAEVLSDPSRLTRGQLQWNADSGAYALSEGDNTLALALADRMTEKVSVAAAGGIVTGNYSLSEYGATVLSLNARTAELNKQKLDYQKPLNESLEFRRAALSSVNLDEEMANMLVYQQAYSAAARVINTISELFDILENIKA